MSRALEGVVFWLLASIWVTHGVRLFDEQGFGRSGVLAVG